MNFVGLQTSILTVFSLTSFLAKKKLAQIFAFPQKENTILYQFQTCLTTKTNRLLKRRKMFTTLETKPLRGKLNWSSSQKSTQLFYGGKLKHIIVPELSMAANATVRSASGETIRVYVVLASSSFQIFGSSQAPPPSAWSTPRNGEIAR